MDVIVGAGVVGLSIAWRLARDGRPVTVVDPAPATGASHAAAGMLAPVSEVTYTEGPLLRLGVASLRRWPSFAADLAADAGLAAADSGFTPAGPDSGTFGGRAGPGFTPAGTDGGFGISAQARAGLDLRADGTLDVAFGADDLAALDELAAYMDKLGLRVERLTGRECRRLEPMLAPSVRGGLLAPGDAWVDPRRVTAALLAALDRLGVPLVRARAGGLLREGDRVTGVRLAYPGDAEPGGPPELGADRVILAAGVWSTELADVPVRPVKGQIMRLRSPQPLLSRCVRGTVHGSPVYLVPRGDGELVVGATQEELGFDTRVTAGGLYELLRDARELVPGVTELEVADVVAGLRPGTPDNLPLIGPSGTPGLFLATGHHRGGVLLAPLTAALVSGAVAADTADTAGGAAMPAVPGAAVPSVPGAAGGAAGTVGGSTEADGSGRSVADAVLGDEGELADLCSPERFREIS
ncbi:FAD-dependent oxidoreductase [Nonomuraea jiangxiensis]|uniref:Glycine oxidase n=1 Tax=Nonomuraea jiangxiensis TaxID=633440 RepID=A0A1G8H907_9ACTN|nr:FAD-dependent oxidoreductase [Nonomuraea jiangxiensis]SDI02970.1 glycine oxidase [Nonomuraea jiangxiensis]